MKTNTTKSNTLVAILLLSTLFVQSCSSLKGSTRDLKKTTHKGRHEKSYNNYDKKVYPNEVYVISNMIAVVQPELPELERNTVATHISLAIKKFKIEPQIIVAIIDTESNFQADKISTTGDVSVAQINVEVWNKEFLRMKKPIMIKGKIKMNQEYALLKMAEILHIIKKRHEKKDRRWYARYHSNTQKHKSDYLSKLEIRLKMLASSSQLNLKLAQNNFTQSKKRSF
jgi:hypothetical protein